MGIELVLGAPASLELYDAWLAAGFGAHELDIPIERNIRSDGRPTLAGVMREGRKSLCSAGRIAAAARAGQYDGIWANSHWTHMDAVLAGTLCRKPVILHLHEEAMDGLARRLRGIAVCIARTTVAVSHGVAEGLPRHAQKRVCVIPNGVDVEVMSPAADADRDEVRRTRADFGIGDGDIMVLAASRIDPSKCIEDLIETIRGVDDPRARLVVAGSTSAYPEYERDVRAKASELPRGRINFCGNRDDMVQLFRASDIVLHAGIVEGMPLGLIEAQSCAKPVVAYGVAGVPEAVIHAVTGLLSRPRDIAGLTTGLRTLVQNAALRAEMGSAAREHVMSHHRIDRQADRNCAVLREMFDSTALTAT
jgi:glycosyltransferase involved in cell wall biosynthesis